MSVINQMLKDLESRQENGDQLPQPDFSKKQRRWPVWLGLLVLLLVGVGLMWLWLFKPMEAPKTLTPPVSKVSESVAPKVEPKKMVQPATPQPVAKKAEPIKSVEAELQTPDIAQQARPAEPVPTEETVIAPSPVRTESVTTMPVAALPIAAKPQNNQAKVQLHHVSPEELVTTELKRAESHLQMGQQGKAEASYQTALRVRPGLLEGRIALAQLYLQQRRWQPAWQQAEAGLKFHPNSLTLKRIKAHALYQQGEVNAAWQTLQQVGEQQYLDDDFLMLKAGLASQLHFYEAAYIIYVKLTERSPMEGRWWFGRALNADYMKRPEEALSCYQRALSRGDVGLATQKYAEQRVQQIKAQTWQK